MRLLKDTAIYFSLSLGQKGIGFLLLPVYTAFLSPEDYGIVGAVGAVVGLLQLLYPLGCDAALARSYFPNAESAGSDYRRVWGTLLLFVLLVGGVGTLGLSLGAPWVLAPVMKGVAFWPCVFLGLIAAFAGPVRTLYSTSLQIRERAGEYLSIEGGFMLLRIVVMLMLVVVFRMESTGILLSGAIAESVFALVSLWRFKGDVWWGIDRPILRKALGYSLPVVPHMLAGWSTTYMASLVLINLEGKAQTGLYGLAATLASVESFLVAGFGQAFLPRVYAVLASDEPSELEGLNRRTVAAVAGFAIGAVGLSLFSPEILRLMTRPAYWGASEVIPLLVLAGFFQGVYSLYSLLLYYHPNGTRFLPLASVAGGIVSVALMFVLIPRFSIMGAAIAGCLGVMTRLVVAAVICNFRYSIPWSQGRLLLLSGVGTALVMMPSFVPVLAGGGRNSLGPKTLAAAGATAVLWWLLPGPVRSEIMALARARLKGSG